MINEHRNYSNHADVLYAIDYTILSKIKSNQKSVNFRSWYSLPLRPCTCISLYSIRRM